MSRMFRIVLAILALMASAHAQWNEQVLYSFQGGTDGATPVGSVVFDQQGNLYGATRSGGSASCFGPFGCGTVYKLSPPTQNGDPWTETILYVFKGNVQGDGAAPLGGLIADAAGNLYGTTGYDGTGRCTLFGSIDGCGTVYEMSPPSQPGGAWTETILYSFQGGNDGYSPIGDLVFDNDGNLYGATLFGGGKGTNCNSLYGGNCGTIFELSPPKIKGESWTEKVLHSFSSAGTWSAYGDGAEPNGGVVLDDRGNLYGTTNFGGYAIGKCNGGVGGTGCGTVFMLSPPRGNDTWVETILHRFVSAPDDGAGPESGVILDGYGGLLGTTYAGGGNRSPSGTIFRLEPQPDGTWSQQILLKLSDDSRGAFPEGPVALGPNGSLYGTASGGGANGGGTLLQLYPLTAGEDAWGTTVLYSFGANGDAYFPDARLIFHSGAIYSTSSKGGTGGEQNCEYGGCGTVYKAWP